ncbi:hypothetical protein [Polaribacter cellanae]|uniref:Uncharacterized protein n=1 Tax=Polaribacter cellanae TaxID=2818493 RepID=A0A975CV65_9FLAO|nr:hypothetical protein [Polaribacter cellanae]QTE24161.1 hypothetical protein J3359_07830 [Polaribacter cellanae]
MLAIDNANGGVYDIENFAELPNELHEYIQQRQFNFVPTYSSLNISGGNQIINPTDLNKNYSPLSPPLAPKNSCFDNFYTNPLSSKGHTQFTLKNGNDIFCSNCNSNRILIASIQKKNVFYMLFPFFEKIRHICNNCKTIF